MVYDGTQWEFVIRLHSKNGLTLRRGTLKKYSNVAQTSEYGNNSFNTSERYIIICDFRHFERHFMFSQGDRKEKKNLALL